MDALISLDHNMFTDINWGLSNSAFDLFFPFITDLHRNPWFIGLVILLSGYWVWRQRQKAAAGLICAALTIGISDIATSQLLKPIFKRDRPNSSVVAVHLRTHPHSGPSFPSNHAVNTFAAATVLSALLPPAMIFWYLCAVLVAFSRIYVGVHYPSDVLVGAAFGICVGLLAVRLILPWVQRKFGSPQLEIE